MKILSAKQIQSLDKHTIHHEPISAYDLMERASTRLSNAIDAQHKKSTWAVFCGPGNNGGDGLAIARLLLQNGHRVHVYSVLKNKTKQSVEREKNWQKWLALTATSHLITNAEEIPTRLDPNVKIIDSLFGSGLNRPLEGHFEDVVQWLNKQSNHVISIDIPSGLFADEVNFSESKTVLNADETYSVQLPKRSFYGKATAPYVGKVHIVDVGLSHEFMEEVKSDYTLYNSQLAATDYKPRNSFGYKNKYGHGFLICGAAQTFGAALLSAKGCLKAGVGLLSMLAPKEKTQTVNLAFPEAMVVLEEEGFTENDLSKYDAIGVGSGLGTDKRANDLLLSVLKFYKRPVVFDADALNILSQNPALLQKLPKNSILTPHVGEFKRLLGLEKLPTDYLEAAQGFAQANEVIIVLKDFNTAVIDSNGKDISFISNGTSALATAGSGDVLAGIITALCCNGYEPLVAARLGAYLHAETGRIAGEHLGLESTLASDIPDFLGAAFKGLKN